MSACASAVESAVRIESGIFVWSMKCTYAGGSVYASGPLSATAGMVTPAVWTSAPVGRGANLSPRASTNQPAVASPCALHR